MISNYKSKFNPIILFFARPLSNVNPSILTLLGLIPPLLFFYFLSINEFLLALISLLGVFFDTLDGAVARLTGKVSKFGGLLDSTIDRIADAIYLFAFASSGFISFELALLAIILSYLISYIRSRAEIDLEGRKLNVGIIERGERLLFIFISSLLLLIFNGGVVNNINVIEILYILLSILSFITIVQRLVIAKKMFKETFKS